MDARTASPTTPDCLAWPNNINNSSSVSTLSRVPLNPLATASNAAGFDSTPPIVAKSNAAALGVDWTISPELARKFTGNNITLQGNMDPSRLLSPPSEIKKIVTEMINAFGKDKYIVNLGHGILPNIPLDNAKAFIDAVKEYSPINSY